MASRGNGFLGFSPFFSRKCARSSGRAFSRHVDSDANTERPPDMFASDVANVNVAFVQAKRRTAFRDPTACRPTSAVTTVAYRCCCTIVFIDRIQVSRCAGLPWHHHRRAPAEYDDDDDDNRYKQQQSARREPAERDYEERQEEAAAAAAYDEPPEQNYEVDEAASVLSDGRVHGVQPTQGDGGGGGGGGGGGSGTSGGGDGTRSGGGGGSTSGGGKDAPRKSGYVVDGKHYRKYRVEEETPDGFIVGEYGVVSHRDGTTRGVRYTADSSIDPRVVYEALAKFLSLRRRRRRRR